MDDAFTYAFTSFYTIVFWGFYLFVVVLFFIFCFLVHQAVKMQQHEFAFLNMILKDALL